LNAVVDVFLLEIERLGAGRLGKGLELGE